MMSYTQPSVAINPFPSKGELVVLFAGEQHTEPYHLAGPQVLDYHLVHYVVSGKGRFRCLGKDYELGPGDHFFIYPGELVRYESDEIDPWHYRWIGFKGVMADQLLSLQDISPHSPTLHTKRSRNIATLFHNVYRVLHAGDAASDLRAEGYLRLLLAEWVKHNDAVPARSGSEHPTQHQVEHAIRWLNLQYSKPITIAEMAHSLGYHRTYLSKIFKQQTSLSPISYLQNIRMERAKVLLQERLTIEQIASSVGYQDALYFSRQFKKWCGTTPSEYRLQQPGRDYGCR
ncbi:AraC family transcriptional regulator [Paenibacillus sp. FA6]|uniref:AraC family transcriptional regulator n=1 Tax=Paenibacillus sp. FA6 TaxID=3413029 RepID=UPI003F659A80